MVSIHANMAFLCQAALHQDEMPPLDLEGNGRARIIEAAAKKGKGKGNAREMVARADGKKGGARRTAAPHGGKGTLRSKNA